MSETREPCRYCVLHALGPDKVGLLSRLSRAAEVCEVDILESIAHVLGNQAMLFMHLAAPRQQLEDFKERIAEEFGDPELECQFREADSPKLGPDWLALPWRIQIIAYDERGVLARIAEFLSQYRLDIVSYHDEPYLPPRSSSQARILTFTVFLPRVFDRGEFAAELQVLADRGNFLSATHNPI